MKKSNQKISQKSGRKITSIVFHPVHQTGKEQTLLPKKKPGTKEERQLQKLQGTDDTVSVESDAVLPDPLGQDIGWKSKRKKCPKLNSVKKGDGDDHHHPPYISVISHHDTKLDRNLNDEVMLSDGRENEDSQRVITPRIQMSLRTVATHPLQWVNQDSQASKKSH